MKFKIFLTLVAAGIIGVGFARAATENPEFTAKKKVVESVVNENYSGPENVSVSATADELRNDWLPYVNSQFDKIEILKGSYLKDVKTFADGSVYVTTNLGSNVKKLARIPFFSSASFVFKPTASEGNLKIQLTKIYVGFFPIDPNYVQKIVSRWGVDLNNFVVKVYRFTFNEVTVTDSGATISGKYQLPKKIAPGVKK